jgi:hypothetical protein
MFSKAGMYICKIKWGEILFWLILSAKLNKKNDIYI